LCLMNPIEKFISRRRIERKHRERAEELLVGREGQMRTIKDTIQEKISQARVQGGSGDYDQIMNKNWEEFFKLERKITNARGHVATHGQEFGIITYLKNWLIALATKK
jgi:hypothetical protein